MVVTPKQLESRVSQKVSQEAEALERKIDEMLEKEIMARGSINVPIYLNANFQNTTPYTIQLVIEKYKAAGWDVKHNSDQREGDYYEFKARHNSHDGGFYDR